MALSSSTLSIKSLYKKLSWKFELQAAKFSWPQCGGEKTRAQTRNSKAQERSALGEAAKTAAVASTRTSLVPRPSAAYTAAALQTAFPG